MNNKKIEELKKKVDYLCENSQNYTIKKMKSEVKRIEKNTIAF